MATPTERAPQKALLSILLICMISSFAKVQQVSAVKVDCYPIEGATKSKCLDLGCRWAPVKQTNESKTEKPRVDEPWCYFPPGYVGYDHYHNLYDPEGFKMVITRITPSVFVDDVQTLTVQALEMDNVLRLRIFDSNSERFEPELPKLNFKAKPAKTDGIFDAVRLSEKESEKYVVKRRATGEVLFETDLRQLLYADKFIQINTLLASSYLYGLGEHYGPFLKRADSKYKAFSFYNTDKLPLPDGQRSYGGFPFYINLSSKNQSTAHGVYLHNSNAMDVVIQSDQSITLRTTGGILDFFIFAGPTANEVAQQFQQLVGLPELPPRWALGFHLCRYNYNSLSKTKEVWRRTREAGIPFDVQWNDLDYMERGNDFTYDKKAYKGLPEFVEELHNKNMHYMILVDPGLSQEKGYQPYELGNQMDIFIKNATNQTLVGKVWNRSGRTVFPDFSNEKSHDFWSQLFVEFQTKLKFDGAWIDMNDISNFVDGSLDGCPWQANEERPPYKPGGYNLQTKSLCLSAKHRAGLEYNVHNLYSQYEAIATRKALEQARPNRRSLIISRSTSPGQGSYGGHWSGDVLSNWDYLKWSIPSLLEHSLYGFSLMGSDICGFSGNTTAQLCARWSTLGAFYTFSRNHNDDVSIDQDPVALGPDVISANKNALTKRYTLLPYLYSAMFEANKFGSPVVRSVPFEFHSKDKEALKVEDQFLFGKALMVSPIVEPNTYSKRTYLPLGRWYETDLLPESERQAPKIINSLGGAAGWHETKSVGLNNMPLFYRGQTILPVYPQAKQTVVETVKQRIGLDIALCGKGAATGELYLDDGESIEIKANHIQLKADEGKLNITMEADDYSPRVEFSRVRVFGVQSPISLVKIESANKTLPFSLKQHMLIFDLDGAYVSKQENLDVVWMS